jgi:hypothetical protein
MNAHSNAASNASGNAQAADPLSLAISHQLAIRGLMDKVAANSRCVGQLLAGRKVRRRRDSAEFLVVEARLGLGATVMLHGRRDGKGRNVAIGTVMDIVPLGVTP